MGGWAVYESFFQETHKRPLDSAGPFILQSSLSLGPFECLPWLQRNKISDIQIAELVSDVKV